MTTPKNASELFFRKEPPTDAEWLDLIETLRTIITPLLEGIRLETLSKIQLWKSDHAGTIHSRLGEAPPTIGEGQPERSDSNSNIGVRGLFWLEKIDASYGQTGYVERGNPPFRILSGQSDNPIKQVREYVFWGLSRHGQWILVELEAKLDQREFSIYRNRFFRATRVKTTLVNGPIEIVNAMARMNYNWHRGLPGIWLALTQMIENIYNYACGRFKNAEEARDAMRSEVTLIRGANAASWRIQDLF